MVAIRSLDWQCNSNFPAIYNSTLWYGFVTTFVEKYGMTILINTVNEEFRIVVPVFNEARTLERILDRIKALGYLDRIHFVNDASTDSTREILKRWESTYNISVLHLEKNMRKEGAIREVLERMAQDGTLPRYIFILDADSFIETDGVTIDDIFRQCSVYMVEKNLAGLALRIEADIGEKSNPLQKCVYVDYAAVQIDNWVTAKQSQLWLINGPGGLFESQHLLVALRSMTPDFETGDLQISVNLMKQGLRIGFSPNITVKTAVPDTISAYFRQRRRWERGTIKVIWSDRRFYWSLFPTCRILALQTMIHMSIYAGVLYFFITALLIPDALAIIITQVILVGIIWYSLSIIKLALNPKVRSSKFVSKVPMWAVWNGVIWLFVTSPARVYGCIEALSHLYIKARLKASKQT